MDDYHRKEVGVRVFALETLPRGILFVILLARSHSLIIKTASNLIDVRYVNYHVIAYTTHVFMFEFKYSF